MAYCVEETSRIKPSNITKEFWLAVFIPLWAIPSSQRDVQHKRIIISLTVATQTERKLRIGLIERYFF